MQTEDHENWDGWEECYDQYGRLRHRPAGLMPVPEQVGDIDSVTGGVVARVTVQHADDFPPNMRIWPCGDNYDAPSFLRMLPLPRYWGRR